MTKIKRLLESTLHTGDFTYLQGEARTGVSYPVLEDILAGQYQSVVSTRPEAKGPSSLFYSLYEPTRAMHQLATDLFNNYLGRPNRRTSRDGAIWRLLRNIHAKISAYQPDARAEAAKPMPDIAAKLSSMAEGPISQSCLAVTAAAYLQTGVLHFRNSLAIPETRGQRQHHHLAGYARRTARARRLLWGLLPGPRHTQRPISPLGKRLLYASALSRHRSRLHQW